MRCCNMFKLDNFPDNQRGSDSVLLSKRQIRSSDTSNTPCLNLAPIALKNVFLDENGRNLAGCFWEIQACLESNADFSMSDRR